jgi:hypothetical protein
VEEAVARSSSLQRASIRALVAAGVALLAASASAADELPWIADRMAAFAKAADERKLVLVIDVAGDFLVDPAASPQLTFYRSLALSDRRVAELIASRFIVTIRNVGPSPALQTSAAKGEPQAPPNDFAIAFICLPSQRVLHFVPGLVSADVMLAHLHWADDCNRQRLQASPGDGSWLVHQRHAQATLPAHRKAFFERRPSRWQTDSQAPSAGSRDGFLAAARVASAIRDQMLSERLRGTLPSEAAQQAMFTVLASHGELEPGTAHQLLSEYPLPRLDEVERPLYEIVSRQRYWERPAGGGAISSWWSAPKNQRRFRLLVVKQDPFYGPELTSQQPTIVPVLLAALPVDRRQVAGTTVTLEELAVLVAEAKLEPIRFTAKEGPPRYVVFDARGFLICQLPAAEATIQRLSQALRATSKAGDVAIAQGTEGGTIDEND